MARTRRTARAKAVPAVRLAMVALRAPPVALIELPVLFRPSLTMPARPEQRRIIIATTAALLTRRLDRQMDARSQPEQSLACD